MVTHYGTQTIRPALTSDDFLIKMHLKSEDVVFDAQEEFAES